jgi:Domain of unknown function (DUF4145)
MLLECHYCEAMVDAKELAEYEYEDAFWNSKVTLAKCLVCSAPLLASQDNPGNGWDKPVRVFPPKERELGGGIPKAIRDAFAEARTCYRTKAFTAAAIMCRKTLEGICSEHGAKSGPLAAQLKKLKENGTIESRLFEWAEALRTTGNEAAHGVEVVISPQDARDTLEFTEALIEYVFTYRDKFERFKKRRAKAAFSKKEKSDESF